MINSMFREIALPKDNEEEFVEVASRLGIKKLYFLYNFDEFDEKIQEKIEKVNGLKGIKVETGFLVNQKNLGKASKKSNLLVVISSDKDRFFIDGKKIKLIYGFEMSPKKDYLHQRASGLNHILCELIKKNDIAVGFSYSMLLGKDTKTIPVYIGRLLQNIGLCEKYKVKTIIASFAVNPWEMRPPHDIINLFSLLKMDGRKVKESITYNL